MLLLIPGVLEADELELARTWLARRISSGSTAW
jgi:hypothetical protein